MQCYIMHLMNKKIIYKTGNILTSVTSGIIVHGCNAQGVMGAGLALQIKKLYPACYERYRYAYTSHNNSLELGRVIWCVIPEQELMIGNAITQEYYGTGKVQVDYHAMKLVMEECNAFMGEYKDLAEDDNPTIHFPMIGAGLGGGSWRKISNIIERGAKTFQPVVYVL